MARPRGPQQTRPRRGQLYEASDRRPHGTRAFPATRGPTGRTPSRSCRASKWLTVWHASKFTREVLDGLLRIGFVHHQQIIWDKGRTVLTRTHYWFQHEPCWYVQEEERTVVRQGRRKLHRLGLVPSPKFIMGGSKEEKFDHPTQKPVELMRRPILNHTKRGELVYDPFLGRGTTLMAAEVTERVCCGIELDPQVRGRCRSTLAGSHRPAGDAGWGRANVR